MTNDVRLRDVIEADLPIFFEHQLDPDATQMAAFPSRERDAFMTHWAKILADPTGGKQTILVDGQVAGNIVSFDQSGEREVGYWLGRDYWGRGVATKALAAYLAHETTRPLYAFVAKHNVGSRRVLEKCGFTIYAEESEGFILKLSMTPYIPIPNPLTPAWLTAVLDASGLLAGGEVLGVAITETGAFNSHTQRLHVQYSSDATAGLAPNMVLKRNTDEPWAIEAGAEEVKFYQLVATLRPAPPALVPCYAAAYDPASGNSYLLLRDLSATHAPPITRDQQVSIVEAVPPAAAIERVIDTLAQHHAYWWDHPLLASGTFEIGYWTRNADRFAQYLQRRQNAWESLRENEAGWFPGELRDLYEHVLAHLPQHWQAYLEPRFRAKTNLTLLHGDAYFANFLCPKDSGDDATYLLDWQSPSVDIAGYDLANLCATFWTSEQRHEARREELILRRYLSTLQACGVRNYGWDDLIADYRHGLIYWLLVPLQDRRDGAGKDYWWPKMQCLVAAFREWRCEELLGMEPS